jgi:hypothetical protein
MIKKEIRLSIEFPEVNERVITETSICYITNIDYVGQLIYFKDEQYLDSLSFADFLTRFRFINGEWTC